MALTDVLRQRVDQAHQTAQVDCGGLGELTVEALPLRECALLTTSPDPNRSILYAACRELQHAGEALRQEGKVFRPEDITQHISDEEAALAAEAILHLSGWTAPVKGEKAELPASQDASLPGQTSLAPPAADAPVSAVPLPAADSAASSGDSVAFQSASPAQGTSQPQPLSLTRYADSASQSGLARHMAGRSSVEAELSMAEAPSARTAIPQQRETTADTLARQLLAGLRRAAAVR